MPEYRDPRELHYIQSRQDSSLMTIKEYAQMMQDGVEFDPIEAVEDNESNIFVFDPS